MVLLLPTAVAIELFCRHFVQVDIRHIEFLRQGCQPLRLRLAHDVAVFIESIARRERHQNGMSTTGTYLADISADIVAVAVDGVLTLRALIEANNHCVRVQSGNNATCSPLVEELSTVVMADAHQHPIACFQRVPDGRPQIRVERASRHTAQSLILHGDLSGVEVLREIVSPPPLSVGAVTARTISHR